MEKMPVATFIQKLRDIADNYKTLYVMGCFGAPLTGSNVQTYLSNHPYNRQSTRQTFIKAKANQSPPVFGFDCVCLIKAVLWGWDGNATKTYGGAKYASNEVPDVGADVMISLCKNANGVFKDIQPGEAVWLPGHIGVYLGDGIVVESSPAFRNCVQYTALGNIGSKAVRNSRIWKKHGKLPYVDYTSQMLIPKTEVKQPDNPFVPVIWKQLINYGYSTHGAAGVIANMLIESGCNPKAVTGVQPEELDAYWSTLDDSTYKHDFQTQQLMDGHSIGIGSWSHPDRKLNMMKLAASWESGMSDIRLQLAYLHWEIRQNTELFNVLTGEYMYQDTTKAFYKWWLGAVNVSDSVAAKRIQTAMSIYKQFVSDDETLFNISVGKYCFFTGGKVFTSSDAADDKGYTKQAGMVTVTIQKPSAKHTLHVTGAVTGWVNAENVAAFDGHTTANLNLRSGNSTNYSVTGVIPAATKVFILSGTNGWYRVYSQHLNKIGYVAAQYVSTDATATVSDTTAV